LNGAFYFGVPAARAPILSSGVGVRGPERSGILALSEAGVGYYGVF
tara:strand:+ start:1477 stop:1614 length:138 start_codon:yes stop_codon:yes gene_type:complete